MAHVTPETTRYEQIASLLSLRERQMALLSELGLRAPQEGDLHAFLGRAAEETRAILDVDLCSVLELRNGSHQLVLEAGAGWPTEQLGRAVFDEALRSDALSTDVKATLCAGIPGQEEPVGVLAVHQRTARFFDRGDADFLQAVADVLGAAIGRARATLRLTIERATAEVLATARSPDEAAERVLELFARHFHIRVGELWVPDDEGRLLLCLRSIVRDGDGHLEELRHSFASGSFHKGEGFPGRIWSQGRSLWMTEPTDPAQSTRAPLAARLQLQSGFGFPVRAGPDIVGVVTAFSRHRKLPDVATLRSLEAVGRSVGEFMRRAHIEKEQRVWQRRLRESEHRFRTLAEAIPHLVFTTDPVGTPNYHNRRALEFLGRNPVDLNRPMAWLESVHPDDRETVWTRARDCIEAPKECRQDLRLRRADGAYLWHSVHAVPIRDEQGRVAQWFGTLTNVDDRKHAEEALVLAHRQKDQFLAILSHELRNPLAAIRSAAELLELTHPNDPDLRVTQSILDRQSAHMARLIDGLLDVSRIVHGKLRLHTSRIDVVRVLREEVQDRTAYVRQRGLGLRTELPGEPLWVEGDRVRLAQVFDNLLGNAADFTTPPGTITVVADRQGDEAVMRVRDTGVGLTQDMRERIFQPFQQAPQDMARTAGGLGLGLALSKGIVDLHRGRIDAHSEGPGTGSEFVVRLPLAEPPADGLEPRGVAGPEGARILVVEDNEDAAELLRRLLVRQGHEVEVVTNGPAALESLRRELPAAVLCDVGLPGMSGYDVARAVRAEERLRGVPLIALTGYGRAEDRHRSDEAGFDAHLTKPASLDDIRAALDRFIRR